VTEHGIAFRFLADLMRVGAAISALAALVGIPSIGLGARFLLVLLVLLIPRAVGGVAAPLDFAFATTLLAAAWISTANWYGAPLAWLVHAVATGVTATVLYLVLAAAGLLPGSAGQSVVARARVAVETAAIGVAVGGVWEAYRWLEPMTGSTLPARSATDLVVHLLVDVVGALIAGAVLAAVRRSDDDIDVDGHSPQVPADGHHGSIL
jgi:hypothetical protein